MKKEELAIKRAEMLRRPSKKQEELKKFRSQKLFEDEAIEEKEKAKNRNNQEPNPFISKREYLLQKKQEQLKQRYNPDFSESQMYQTPAQSKSQLLEMSGNKEFSRDEWWEFIKLKSIKTASRTRLKRSLVHGIPSDMRGQIWPILCKSEEQREIYAPGVYWKLLGMQHPDETIIIKDLHRTLPDENKNLFD